MIESNRLYEKLDTMTDQECIDILDPICKSVHGTVKIHGGIEVLANRIFALAVLELYEQWQTELYERD